MFHQNKTERKSTIVSLEQTTMTWLFKNTGCLSCGSRWTLTERSGFVHSQSLVLKDRGSKTSPLSWQYGFPLPFQFEGGWGVFSIRGDMDRVSYRVRETSLGGQM